MPNAFTAASTSATHLRFSEMSVGTLIASAPSSSSSARVRSPRCAFHSAITTCAPSLANLWAMPRPMP